MFDKFLQGSKYIKKIRELGALAISSSYFQKIFKPNPAHLKKKSKIHSLTKYLEQVLTEYNLGYTDYIVTNTGKSLCCYYVVDMLLRTL